MTPEQKSERKRYVCRLALDQYDSLSIPDRIRLLEGLALILPKKEAATAAQTAFLLRKAQEHQLAFRELLNADPSGDGAAQKGDGQ